MNNSIKDLGGYESGRVKLTSIFIYLSKKFSHIQKDTKNEKPLLKTCTFYKLVVDKIKQILLLFKLNFFISLLSVTSTNIFTLF